ncbi:hypothetical protein [Streptomyces lavendulae]|uniref:hypothetical protein n=1 Tax=Streptomyces lavendulae TaxID=1914 RepID=UPI003401E720
MPKTRVAERRLTFQEIAERANTSHTRVRTIVAAGILGESGYQPGNRNGLTEDEGALIASVLRANAASPTTAQILKTDPGKVLEAALALAELARRQMHRGTNAEAGELNAAA